MGESGRAAFLDRYNWDSTSGELIELYERLSGTAGEGEGPDRNTKSGDREGQEGS